LQLVGQRDDALAASNTTAWRQPESAGRVLSDGYATTGPETVFSEYTNGGTSRAPSIGDMQIRHQSFTELDKANPADACAREVHGAFNRQEADFSGWMTQP
jgi:hypothetical protein